MNISDFRLATFCKRMVIAIIFYPPLAFSDGADITEFNIDVLDVKERDSLDLSRFSQAGYIMPGDYFLIVKVNGKMLQENSIHYRILSENDTLSQPLLTEELVRQFGLKNAYYKNLIWEDDGGVRFSSLPGMMVKTDSATSTLNISLPQIYLEYMNENWDPPARWDNGVNGLLLDYNVNAGTIRESRQSDRHSLTGSGTLGANVGVWRLRADWQLEDLLSDRHYQSRGLVWSRYYLYRPLPEWRARLTIGENYLTSDLFDSFRFSGVTLASDVTMLPPTLRGYAPEVKGVAASNATVVISQQGRILYQTQVAPGPFSIQDLNSSVSGTLDVEVREQDGRINRYQVSTATLPYLARPGTVRYNFSGGKAGGRYRADNGPIFSAGEATWGVTNGWSLYGGALGSDNYQAVTMGIGRDLYQFGALSSDVTMSRSRFNNDPWLQGKSLRLSYAKIFEDYNSQVTFAGYRFSEESFYSMADYLAKLQSHNGWHGNSKERYDISLNQRFPDMGISTYLTYTHQSYWDRAATDRLELSLNTYLNVGNLRNLSVSARVYRQNNYSTSDNGIMLSLNLPWGDKGYMTYSGNKSRRDISQSVGYSGTAGADNYTVRSTVNRHHSELSGFWRHRGEQSDISVSATGNTASRTAVDFGMNGGLTLTSQGAALHGGSSNGGTRLMIDTDGTAGVPLQGNGSSASTNSQGLAVLTNVSSYTRTHAGIRLSQLGDQMEAADSMIQMTLTEGAIGYRKIDIVTGRKGLAVIRLSDGKAPPFGAMVFTAKGKRAGIVDDDGVVWLSGMRPGEKMRVQWGSEQQCEITLPDNADVNDTSALLLPCEIAESGVSI